MHGHTFHAPRPEVGIREEVTVVSARGLELGLRPVVRELVTGPAPASLCSKLIASLNGSCNHIFTCTGLG